MSDWGYVILACAVAWGGVTFYGVALGRRLTQARRMEQHLRAMIEAESTAAASSAGEPATAGWTAEGDRSACDVVPPAR